MPLDFARLLLLLERLSEDEVCDEDEEVFDLFSGNTASHDLGMLDGQASSVDINVAGQDMTIHQSPGILRSNRSGGTTGAVIWRISVPFANWLASPSNILFHNAVLDTSSTVLELGAGVGVLGLALAPKIHRYIITDQDYMLKLIQRNVHANGHKRKITSKPVTSRSARVHQASSLPPEPLGDIKVLALDWETSEVDGLMQTLHGAKVPSDAPHHGLDVIIACDCIFNDSLVEPFVQTCAALCHLKVSQERQGDVAPTICIIAQQLRSSEVFDLWIRRMRHHFRLWRIRDPILSQLMTETCQAPYTVHIAVLRDALEQRASTGN